MKSIFPKFLLAFVLCLTLSSLSAAHAIGAAPGSGVDLSAAPGNQSIDKISPANRSGNAVSAIGGAARGLLETPLVSIDNLSLDEGNTGVKAFYFIVSLSEASSETITVNYATADGTAISSSDYQPSSGSLTFAPGETAKALVVLVNGDMEIEPDETFTVNLFDAANALISNGTGTGTIRNDDDACANSISPGFLNAGAGASSGNTISVTAPAECAFTATSNDSFITITSGANGSGNGTVTFALAANTGAARTGSITVAGRTFTVNQAAVGSFDLRVSLTDTPDPVALNSGQDIIYTIFVNNDGGVPATGVVLTDTLPAGVNFIAVGTTQGSCSQSNQIVSCNLGSVNGMATVTIIGRPTAAGTFTNTVSVTSNEQDANPGNNSASTSTTVILQPGAISTDLRITAFESPGVPVSLGSGQTVIYSISVDNDGPSPATGVVVTSAFAGGADIISATTSVGSCSITPGLVTCNIGNLVRVASIFIIARPTAVGTLSNTISVRGNEFDPVPSNNTAVLTSRINPAPGTVNADLRITLLEPLDTIIVGSRPDIVYELFVNNDGPSPATGVVVTDILPAGVTFVSAATSQGSCAQANNVVTCNLGTVVERVAISITARPTVSGTVINTVSVRGNEPDFNPSNNSATVGVTVKKSSKRTRAS